MNKKEQAAEVTAPLPHREGQGVGLEGQESPLEAFLIGRLGKPHGVRGEINFPFTSDVWDRAEAEYLFLMVDGILVPFFLEEYRFRSDDLALLKFRGLDTIEAVQEYVGCEVYYEPKTTADGEDTPPWEEGEVAWSYFEGFRIEDAEQGDLGRIARVNDTTANVLFELEDGRLVPAVEDLITDIDHHGRIIRMQLPEGLLEL